MYNIILLNKCNLRCSYCFAEDYMHGEEAVSSDVMSEAVFDSTLDLLEASHADHASLLGGEPTLHPQFRKFWLKALERNMVFSLKSNALWDRDLLNFLNQHTSPLYHYLLNINGPEHLTERQWETVKYNVKNLKSDNIHFQFNIQKPDFDWKWIVDFAKETNVKHIKWSLSAPIHSESTVSNEFASYKSFKHNQSSRLYEFMKVCADSGIKTIGFHGPTPCLISNEQMDDLRKSGSDIDGRCIPVFDIFPDKTIHFCFPLKDFIKPPKIDEVEDLAEVKGIFMRELASLRTHSFPWDECLACPEAISGNCHGGCLSQKKMKTLDVTKSLEKFYDLVPIIHPRVIIISDEEVKLGTAVFGMNDLTMAILKACDSAKSLESIYAEVEAHLDEPRESLKRDLFYITVSDLTGAGLLHYKPQKLSYEFR